MHILTEYFNNTKKIYYDLKSIENKESVKSINISSSLFSNKLSYNYFDFFTGLFKSILLKLDIHVYSNKLPNNYFKNFTNLKKLDLGNNNITELSNNSFNNLTNLEYLNLCNNKLTKLPENCFNNLTNLQELDLSNNILTELPKKCFDNLTNLQALRLSKNNLTKIPEKCFDNLTNLQNLNLRFNKLTKLPEKYFDNLTNLKYLNINNNKLTKLPLSLLKCKQLIYIYFIDNEITLQPQLLKFINNILINNGQLIENFLINIKNKKNIEEYNYEKKEELIQLIINNEYLSQKVKNLLIEYCNDDYDTGLISLLSTYTSFKELLWNIIHVIDKNYYDNKESIYKIMDYDIKKEEYNSKKNKNNIIINCLLEYSSHIQF